MKIPAGRYLRVADRARIEFSGKITVSGQCIVSEHQTDPEFDIDLVCDARDCGRAFGEDFIHDWLMPRRHNE
jgi:hypothetical protein